MYLEMFLCYNSPVLEENLGFLQVCLCLCHSVILIVGICVEGVCST